MTRSTAAADPGTGATRATACGPRTRRGPSACTLVGLASAACLLGAAAVAVLG